MYDTLKALWTLTTLFLSAWQQLWKIELLIYFWSYGGINYLDLENFWHVILVIIYSKLKFRILVCCPMTLETERGGGVNDSTEQSWKHSHKLPLTTECKESLGRPLFSLFMLILREWWEDKRVSKNTKYLTWYT